MRLDLDALHLAALGDVGVLAIRDGHEVRGITVVVIHFDVVDRADVVDPGNLSDWNKQIAVSAHNARLRRFPLDFLRGHRHLVNKKPHHVVI